MYTLLFPNLKTFTISFPNIFDLIVSIDYKKILISFSYVYYVTIFFLLTRVLIYFGLTLIHLINTKHTTALKKNSTRIQLGVFLKFFSKNSFKKFFLKIVAYTCL